MGLRSNVCTYIPLALKELRIHMQIHDFVAIHLVVITADNLNACIHLLYFCSFSRVNQDSMLREYKDGLRKAILRNRMSFARLTHCLQLLVMLYCSCIAIIRH